MKHDDLMDLKEMIEFYSYMKEAISIKVTILENDETVELDSNEIFTIKKAMKNLLQDGIRMLAMGDL